jgi:hypothetical protein
MSSSFKGVWNQLTPESAKFVLDQAEKNLEATVETARSLTDRAINVMQFSVPLSLVLIGLITATSTSVLLIFYVIALGFSLVVSYQGLKLYDIYRIQPLGYKPSDLLKNDVLKMDEETQEMGFVFSAIQDVERAIDINESVNLQRQMLMYSILNWIKAGVTVTLLYPVALFLLGVLP